MKRISYIYVIIYIISQTLFSCTNTIEQEPIKNTNYSLRYEIEENSIERIIATEDENEIKDTYFIFYDIATYKYITYRPAKTELNTLHISLNDVLIEGVEYKTLVLGNMDDYLGTEQNFEEFMESNKHLTYQQFKQSCYAHIKDQVVHPDKLPFGGVLVDINGEEIPFVRPNSSTKYLKNAVVKFTRAIARIDLTNLVPELLDIKWAKVCNYRNKGFIFHEDFAIGEIIQGDSELDPTGKNDGYIEVESAVNFGDKKKQILKSKLYTFTNYISNSKTTDKETTCLLIAGKYKNSDRISYYRANIKGLSNLQIIKRNHAYTITIQNVKGEGSLNEKDALFNSSLLLDYKVGNEWETEGGDIEVDEDGNYLTVSKTLITTSSKKGDIEFITVLSNPKEDWEFRWKDNQKEKHFEITKTSNRSLQITTLNENNSKEMLSNNIEIYVKNTDLRKTVTLIQNSVFEDNPLLTVDDKKGEFYITKPKDKNELKLKVKTGNPYVGWTATYEGDPNMFTFNNSGKHEDDLIITFDNSNSQGNIQKGKLTINRNEGNVPDVIINIIQEPHFNIFKIKPELPEELVVEGFLPKINYEENTLSQIIQFKDYKNIIDITSLSGGREQAEKGHLISKGAINFDLSEHKISLELNQPRLYNLYNFIVSSEDFDPFNELFIFTNNLINPEYKANFDGKHAEIMLNKLNLSSTNEPPAFYIYYFYLGPDDDDIVGNITITAQPKEGVDLPAETKTIRIRITSSGVLGSPIIKHGEFEMKVSDRNVGSPHPREIKKALNYNSSLINHPDKGSINERFIGQLFDFSETSQTENREKNLSILEKCADFAKEYYNESDIEANRWIPFSLTTPIIKGYNNSDLYLIRINNNNNIYLNRNITYSKGRTIVYSTEMENGKITATYLPEQKFNTEESFNSFYISNFLETTTYQNVVTGFNYSKTNKYPKLRSYKVYNTSELKHLNLRCMKYLGDTLPE